MRKSYLWKAPICNLKANRAPKLGQYYFPLCWRCTGILIGSFLLKFNFFSSVIYPKSFGILLILPFLIDVILQYVFCIESKNIRRFFSGIFVVFGINILKK